MAVHNSTIHSTYLFIYNLSAAAGSIAIQHKTVAIIVPIFQTKITAQMLSTYSGGGYCLEIRYGRIVSGGIGAGAERVARDWSARLHVVHGRHYECLPSSTMLFTSVQSASLAEYYMD